MGTNVLGGVWYSCIHLLLIMLLTNHGWKGCGYLHWFPALLSLYTCLAALNIAWLHDCMNATYLPTCLPPPLPPYTYVGRQKNVKVELYTPEVWRWSNSIELWTIAEWMIEWRLKVLKCIYLLSTHFEKSCHLFGNSLFSRFAPPQSLPILIISSIYILPIPTTSSIYKPR